MRQIIVVTCLLVLGGCSLAASVPTAVPPLAGFEGLSVISTKKTLVDHLISFSTGKDCSSVRKGLGRAYCLEDEVSVPEEVYCYESLGNVNCFSEPRPFGQKTSPIGHTAPAAGPPR